MAKIPAYPAITSPDGADLLVIEDVSVNTTKKITLTKLKEWFQSLTSWVTTAMIADAAVTAPLLSTSAITLGYAERTTTYSSGSDGNVTSLSVSVTVPAGGRRILITGYCGNFSNSAANQNIMQIRESSTVLNAARNKITANNDQSSVAVMASFVPSAGSHTYNLYVAQGSAGTMSVNASATEPSYILVQLI